MRGIVVFEFSRDLSREEVGKHLHEVAGSFVRPYAQQAEPTCRLWKVYVGDQYTVEKQKVPVTRLTPHFEQLVDE